MVSASSFSPANACTKGNLLVLVFGIGAGTTLTGVSDSQSNTWTVDISVANGSSCAIGIASSVLTTGLATSDTITCTGSSSLSSVTWGVSLEEFSGILAPGWTDGTASATGSTTALTCGTTAVSSVANEIVVSAWAFANNPTSWSGNGSGFAGNNVTSYWMAGQYEIDTVKGTRSPSGTAGFGQTWVGAVATYKGITMKRQTVSGQAVTRTASWMQGVADGWHRRRSGLLIPEFQLARAA